ncbi:ComEA family DNA-binding protein [Geothrix limicola]|uniref:ComEA family DNA-binding protein n=1 Tax=Geothrix limicola TaxID=2927978 RepID=UPI002555404D|nr:helix-hairpin-helix domain-containing protein [Geothrix limicola]
MFGCTAWGLAQEDETPKPKKAPTTAEQAARAKAREKLRQAKAKADAEAKAKAVDINHATKAELVKVPGITETYADAIIAKRPYRSKADLVTKNAIPKGLYQSVRKLVAAK